MNRPRKLMWKIFIFLIGFCVLLLAVLWILQTSLLETMYQNIRRDELKKAIVLIEENIDSPDLNEIIEDLQHDSEIFVSIANDSGMLNVPARQERGHGMGRNRIRQTITETEEFVRTDGTRVSYTFYAVISPVKATISTIKV